MVFFALAYSCLTFSFKFNFYFKIRFQRKGRDDNKINDRVCVCVCGGGGVQLKGNEVFMRNSEKCRQTSALSCIQCYLWSMHAVYLSLNLKNVWIRGPLLANHCLFDCGRHQLIGHPMCSPVGQGCNNIGILPNRSVCPVWFNTQQQTTVSIIM